MSNKTKKILSSSERLENIAKQLQQKFDAKLSALNSSDHRNIFPSAQKVFKVINQLREIIFAEYFQHNTTQELHIIQPAVRDLIWQSLYCVHAEPICQYNIIDEQAEEFSWQLLEQLPQVRFLLNTDVVAAYNNDPACEACFLPILCYPGILALSYHRIAHILYQSQIPILPRIITELAHNQTGIDIHPGAEIGESFFIDHGTGVVIGETTIIGHHVNVYHGVTLGAKSFPTDEKGNPLKGIKRHPIIGNHVTIYSNAVLLGRINIGDNSVIGGNVWLTESVPSNSQIYQHAQGRCQV